MKLVVGLGNPGARYAATRHNVGFRVIRQLARAHRIAVAIGRGDALIGDGRIGAVPVRLALPQASMNRSGPVVRRLCQAARVGSEAVLVICDDVRLPVGRLRLRAEGSAGGHRGLQSLIEALGGDRFARLRIGVGAPPHGTPMDSYVLAVIPPSERPLIGRAIQQAVAVVETWAVEGSAAAMNRWNAVGTRTP